MPWRSVGIGSEGEERGGGGGGGGETVTSRACRNRSYSSWKLLDIVRWGVDEGELDSKFRQLSQYIQLWATPTSRRIRKLPG